MISILKYLKPYWNQVLLIVILLVVQAFCDLALPQYTSDIVDVGIQQKGIDSAALEAVSASTMEKLKMFMNEEDITLIDENYRKLTSSEATQKEKKTYPLVLSEDIFLLDTKDDMALDDISEVLMMPCIIVNNLGKENTGEMQQNVAGGAAAVPLDSVEEQFADLSDSIKEQMSVNASISEYEKIGMDIDQMQIEYLIWKGVMMLGMTLLMVIVSVSVGLFASRVAAGVGLNVRSEVFRNVVGFSNEQINQFSTASLITRNTNDIQQVQMVIVMLLRMVAYAPILGIGGIIKVVNTKTSMGWIIFVAVAAIMCLIGVLLVVAMPKFKKMQNLVDRLNLVTREILTGLPVIRAFSREKYEEKRFDIANVDLTKTALFTNRVMTFMMPMMMFIMNGVTVMIIWFGAKGIDNGNLQVGDMMAFITYTMQIIMSFLMLSMISILLPRGAVSAKRIDEVIKTKQTIIDKENAVQIEDGKGEVTFQQVSFAYPGADENVIQNISFTAKPGQTTAIIGSTGSGKSTLVNLIPRFYDVTEGSICIDGTDIRDIKQHDLRKMIGFVPQKGILFSGTIASNLRFGCKDAPDEVIERAARIAQATDFIEEKEEKYSNHISQGGNNVSGGQKQRLSIARAIAKDPKIYVFDDSFSALDFKTDVALRKALGENMKDSTVIIVAQRISTILHAEQIIVLDEGEIVGIGTHEQLLENCDIYSQIAQSQLSEKELSGKESASNE